MTQYRRGADRGIQMRGAVRVGIRHHFRWRHQFMRQCLARIYSSFRLYYSRCKGQGGGRREDIGVGILDLCVGHRE
jgi:hypothetical protein